MDFRHHRALPYSESRNSFNESEVEHYVSHRAQGVASERLLAPGSLLDELRTRRRALPSREQRKLLQQHHDSRILAAGKRVLHRRQLRPGEKRGAANRPHQTRQGNEGDGYWPMARVLRREHT